MRMALAASLLISSALLGAAPVVANTYVLDDFKPDQERTAAAAIVAAVFAGHAPVMAEASIADQIIELEEQHQAILARCDEIRTLIEDGAELTDDLEKEIDEKTSDGAKLAKRIASLKKIAPQGAGRKTAPEAGLTPAGAGARVLNTRIDPKHGFQNFGEFAIATRRHAAGQADHDGVKKLQAAATTYGNEGTGADGGFLVPPEFSTEIWKKVEAEENLMARTLELIVSGNSMMVPKDETTPWGTTGPQFYFEGEGSQGSQSKGVFELNQMRLYKLMALVPASEELLEDAVGYTSWLMGKMPQNLAHKINTVILRGTGVGQPLGILNSGSLVSVTKETSQPADTLWAANISKMWARMYAPWRRNSVWLYNQDLEPQLDGLAFQPSGASSMLPTTASTPIYMPPGGIADAPYGRLKGRPAIALQACSAVGDQGDIILVDLKQYQTLRKAAGMKVDTSMHFFFDQAVSAFRFIFRMNGQPAWSAAITPENSANTLSWAVTLDAR